MRRIGQQRTIRSNCFDSAKQMEKLLWQKMRFSKRERRPMVSTSYGRSHPQRTVHEAVEMSRSSGRHDRSAISGRYVMRKHGKTSPHITVREH